MNKINQKLITILLIGYLAFFLIGFVANTLLTSETVVLISRSYCPREQWEQLVSNYHQIYREYQHKSLRIKKVIIFSSFAEQIYEKPPQPEEVYNYQTYGSFEQKRLEKLQQLYPNNKSLLCQ